MSAAVTLSSVRLPGHIAHALRQIAAELRHMPREAVTDRLELVCWLGRQARRLDEVAASRMLDMSVPAPVVVTTMAAPSSLTPCPACEARRRRPRRPGAAAGQLALPFLDREPNAS